MNKKFLILITFIAVTVSSLLPTSVFAQDADDAKSALQATVSYFEAYLENKSSFEVRDYEDVLLTLIADRILDNTDSESYRKISDKAVAYAKSNMNYNSAEFYALMILIADETGCDAKSFNQSNLIEKFADVFSSYDPGSPSINPYYLRYIAAVLDRYAADIPDAGTLTDKLKSIIMSYYKQDGTGAGIDCWNYGISTDDTGAVLPALYFICNADNGTDVSDVQNVVADSIAWALTQLKPDGTVDAFGSVSADSTGLMLHMLATYKNVKSELNFNGLLTLRDISDGISDGTYQSEYDKHYATRDAFYGLISYYLYVTGGGYYLDNPVPAAPEPSVPKLEAPKPSGPDSVPDTGDSENAVQFAFYLITITIILIAASNCVSPTASKRLQNIRNGE